MAGDACRVCKAEVKRAITIGGAIRDLEPRPRPDGNVIIVEHEGRVRARVLGGPEMPAQQEAFKMHACPKPGPVTPGPRCKACHLPMDAGLTALEGWRVHPCCPDQVVARRSIREELERRRAS